MPVASSSTARATPDDFTNMVNNTVYFILISDHHKHPIKRKDIQTHVLKENPKLFKDVFQEAGKKLSDVFGYELIGLEDKQGSYILVSQLNLTGITRFLKRSEMELAHYGLLTMLLALLLMNNGVLSEERLWSMLSHFGLKPEAEVPPFGNLKKLVTSDLVKKAYLEYSAVPDTDPITYQLRWGQRAVKEVAKRDVLQLVFQIMGNEMQPEHWPSVYDNIVRGEQVQQE